MFRAIKQWVLKQKARFILRSKKNSKEKQLRALLPIVKKLIPKEEFYCLTIHTKVKRYYTNAEQLHDDIIAFRKSVDYNDTVKTRNNDMGNILPISDWFLTNNGAWISDYDYLTEVLEEACKLYKELEERVPEATPRASYYRRKFSLAESDLYEVTKEIVHNIF